MATYCPEDSATLELSCPICFEDYDIHVPRRHPKLLLCLHTFCADCIRLLRRQDGTLECSMCRKVHLGVRLEELLDHHVIISHLREKFEERDLELARRIDQEMREQLQEMKTAVDEKKKGSTSSLLGPDTDSLPDLDTEPNFLPVLPPETIFLPVLAPEPVTPSLLGPDRVLTPNPVLHSLLDPDPLLVCAHGVIVPHSSPEVVNLDSMDDTEPELEEEEDLQLVVEEEDVEEEEEIMPFVREETDWSDDEEQEEEEEEDVDVVTDENEGEDNTVDDNGEVMENNDDDEGVDEDGVDQCFVSLHNAMEEFGNDDGSSISDLTDAIDYDNNEDVGRVDEEDDVDGWHSASERCSPEHWNINLSDSSEELDNNSDMTQWPVLTHEALMED